MSDPSFLHIDAVSKAYDQHLAVDQASLHIPRGKIFGLLGPNGAGKTSIIRMITGITIPDGGTIYFDGEELSTKHARRTGYMPEERGLYKKMKVKEQISYLLTLKGLHPKEAKQAALTWLDRLGLGEWADRNPTDLSKGMQQKVQFISTVAHEPDLLILDEPFSGLDPVNAQLIEKEIFDLKEKGTTIIFSTHRLEQVEELCDYIGLINKGQVMLEDEINAVRKQFQKPIYHLEFDGDKEALVSQPQLRLSRLTDKAALIYLNEGQDHKDILRILTDTPIEILSFKLHLPRLNEIFIELVTGKSIVDMTEAEEAAAISATAAPEDEAK